VPITAHAAPSQLEAQHDGPSVRERASATSLNAPTQQSVDEDGLRERRRTTTTTSAHGGAEEHTAGITQREQVARANTATTSSTHQQQHTSLLPSAFRRHFSSSASGSPSSTPPTQATLPPNTPLSAAPPSHLIPLPPAPPTPDHPSSTVPATRSSVITARNAFFDTRVSGRPEIWAAVRLVCELVGSGDLSDAQAVLDAAGGTCPTGVVWGRRGGVYDAWGERYIVPVWCVGWPGEVLRAEGERVMHSGGGLELDEEDDGEEDDGEEDVRFWRNRGSMAVFSDTGPKGKKVDRRSRSEEEEDDRKMKGKEIKVRVRMSNTARDIVVKTGDEDSVGKLMRRVREVGEVGFSFPH
jgi:ubiquitin-binding protein